MIDHNHFICHFIFGGHLLNIPIQTVAKAESMICCQLSTSFKVLEYSPESTAVLLRQY